MKRSLQGSYILLDKDNACINEKYKSKYRAAIIVVKARFQRVHKCSALWIFVCVLLSNVLLAIRHKCLLQQYI